ncbi:MAG: polysaccharide biosynthesis/export family protein [Rhodobacteraceae bacterium]|nr:polysaccharide biosynthesis/export family protein [Paracoccaceae bacterium]
MLVLSLALMSFAAPVAAQDTYNIRAGDILRIEVIEDSTLNRSVLVAPDGRISVPLAGTIVAAGRPISVVQAELSAQLAENFASPPSVFVAVERLAERVARGPSTPVVVPTIEVYILGEVGNPGKLTLSPGTTVFQLFAQMGGFTNFAATRRIQLRRTAADGTETVYPLNYDAMLTGVSPNGTAGIVDGDVIIVPQRRLFEQ